MLCGNLYILQICQIRHLLLLILNSSSIYTLQQT